jgi:biotin carboxyl carrier protein
MLENEFKTFSMWERDYQTLYTKKFLARKPYQAPNSKMIYSFIPGTIREIKIKTGQAVKKGEPILILESMKMLNIIRMPVNGIVKQINIAIGEKVPKTHLMVELE